MCTTAFLGYKRGTFYTCGVSPLRIYGAREFKKQFDSKPLNLKPFGLVYFCQICLASSLFLLPVFLVNKDSHYFVHLKTFTNRMHQRLSEFSLSYQSN